MTPDLSALEEQVIDLCDGEHTLMEIADEAGCTVRTVQKIRRRMRPMSLPVRPAPVAKAHKPNVAVAGGAPCARCGLHGEHECMLGIDHYASSGTTNLGVAVDPRRQW